MALSEWRKIFHFSRSRNACCVLHVILHADLFLWFLFLVFYDLLSRVPSEMLVHGVIIWFHQWVDALSTEECQENLLQNGHPRWGMWQKKCYEHTLQRLHYMACLSIEAKNSFKLRLAKMKRQNKMNKIYFQQYKNT